MTLTLGQAWQGLQRFWSNEHKLDTPARVTVCHVVREGSGYDNDLGFRGFGFRVIFQDLEALLFTKGYFALLMKTAATAVAGITLHSITVGAPANFGAGQVLDLKA